MNLYQNGESSNLYNLNPNWRRIQEFHGGGGAKIMCPLAHYDYERGTEHTVGRGPGGWGCPFPL